MRVRWQTLDRLKELLRPAPTDPAQQLFRLKAVERDIILPIKLLYISVLVYFFYFSPWYSEAGTAMEITQTIIERFFIIYILLNLIVAVYLLGKKRLPLVAGQRVVFIMSFVDSLFLAALTLVTGGFDSILYWLFPGLILRNAVTHPVARVQLILNCTVIASFLLAGGLDVLITNFDLAQMDEPLRRAAMAEHRAEPFTLRVIVLMLLTFSCYGVQALIEKARVAAEETREFIARQEQLRAAGRLAAEIAHQIKNPLGIINNAAYAIQRNLAAGKKLPLEQLDIIREEVTRSDRILTELMGYAQLAEGAVERLNVVEELNRAISKVFPPGIYRTIQVRTDYAPELPPLLMQKKHFAEMVGNILQNAREALVNGGHVDVTAEPREDAVRIIIADDGPGIAPEKTEQIFQSYFSTKQQGTGLGLAISRHNAEIYDGRIHVESELGHGARFILDLPTRTFMRLRK